MDTDIVQAGTSPYRTAGHQDTIPPHSLGQPSQLLPLERPSMASSSNQQLPSTQYSLPNPIPFPYHYTPFSMQQGVPSQFTQFPGQQGDAPPFTPFPYPSPYVPYTPQRSATPPQFPPFSAQHSVPTPVVSTPDVCHDTPTEQTVEAVPQRSQTPASGKCV